MESGARGGRIFGPSVVCEKHRDCEYQVRKGLAQQQQRPNAPLGRRIILKRRSNVIEFVLPALQIERQVVQGTEHRWYEVQKVCCSKAPLSRGCDPDIKKHYWSEQKMKRSSDLIQMRIYENEFRAMQHAAADAYRTDYHESGEKPSCGSIALFEPKKSEGQEDALSATQESKNCSEVERRLQLNYSLPIKHHQRVRVRLGVQS